LNEIIKKQLEDQQIKIKEQELQIKNEKKKRDEITSEYKCQDDTIMALEL
jgi:hypothetical protein